MPVGSLGWEDPLEEEMATHSSILAWEIPGTEEPGELQARGVTKELDMTKRLSTQRETPYSLPLSTSLLSVSTDLPILDISYKWNHTIYGSLCFLASFT